MLNPLKYITQYKFALTVGLFSFWMLFVDDNRALFIYKQYNELKDLKAQERFLKTEIDDMKRQKEDLFSDDDKLERYARELYYFKKDNEDVYVIEKED